MTPTIKEQLKIIRDQCPDIWRLFDSNCPCNYGIKMECPDRDGITGHCLKSSTGFNMELLNKCWHKALYTKQVNIKSINRSDNPFEQNSNIC